MIGNQFPQRLKQLRKDKKLTQKALGVSLDYLVFGGLREEVDLGIEDKEILGLFKETKTLGLHDKIALKKIISDFLLEKKIDRMGY